MKTNDYIYTHSGILSQPLNRSEILTHDTTWIKLEDVMPKVK